MRIVLALLSLIALPASAQSNNGELRLRVTDPSGLGIQSRVELTSEVNQYHTVVMTDESGNLIARRLPRGTYRLQIERQGFAPVSQAIDLRSMAPLEVVVSLTVAPLSTAVTVKDAATLIDPYRAGSTNQIGSETIQNRSTSLPGRSLQDLVNSQPGWLYEGNAVLHPRGSEYQTQFVVDGIPLTDNRSPSFGPEIEADDVDSLSIYTAGIPAEFGRKMGGVVEVSTLRNPLAGLHGKLVLSGGSFDTAGAFTQLQYGWRKHSIGVSAGGNMTSHYLNPVVPQNYTNTGTTGDFALNYQSELTPKDRLSLIVRHGLSRFEIPNEQVQEAAGQRQNGDNSETTGIVSYQHTFSPDTVSTLRGMVRDRSDAFTSNPSSIPVIAFQSNSFREGYFNASLAIHRGRNQWKAGVESDVLFLHENFSDVITDSAQFDPGTPATFAFKDHRPDLEQSAFVEDLIRLGEWTVSAGVRWDHYQLVANQNAVSPRLSVARYFAPAQLVLHASYDRVFQTPSFENILLASSTAVESLNPSVLRLPIDPSHGNYYELGLTKGFFSELRFDANYFRRSVNNFADDDQLLSTAISFPISFAKAVIYGAEGKIEVPDWKRFSGFVSYSYTVGNAWFPVTGGLFLGNDATSATTQLAGHFPDSQDQRNTLRTRTRYQVTPRVWVAGGAEYGSGLPFDFAGTYQQALAEYGQRVVDRINFARGRVKPNLSIGVSAGAELYAKDNLKVRIQADGQNLNNRLNILDFGGLFSGNAIAPPRSYALRLITSF